METLRERVAFMLGRCARATSRSRCPLAGDASAWSTALAVLEEMEGGYRKASATASLAQHEALVTQRIRPLPRSADAPPRDRLQAGGGALWSRCTSSMRSAEKAGIAAEKVKDSLEKRRRIVGDAGLRERGSSSMRSGSTR
jgi:hypothetical protein